MGNAVLHAAYARGHFAALHKFALATPSAADEFVAEMDNGKDMPPPGASPPLAGGPERMDAPVLPQEPPEAAQGDATGAIPGPGLEPPKEGALSPKDMAWFRDSLGEEAGKLFLDKHHARYSTGIPQNFKPGAPVQTTPPRPVAPPPVPGAPPKVQISPLALKPR